MPGFFFVGKRLNSRMNVQNTPFSPIKNDVTLNITKVKYTINFQIMPFMVENKTQIASNMHRYKKIVKKTHKSPTIHTSLYIRKCHM